MPIRWGEMTDNIGCKVNLHAVLPRSRANGPGTRFAIWFQGCSLGCPACFNPETHSTESKLIVDTDDLISRIVRDREEIDGITISGGEAMEQAEGLFRLLSGVRGSAGMSVLMFSGYTLEEILAMSLGEQIIGLVDVLIAGRYQKSRRLARSLRGSDNQIIHLLSGCYSCEDICRVPFGEIVIGQTGEIAVSGIRPITLKHLTE